MPKSPSRLGKGLSALVTSSSSKTNRPPAAAGPPHADPNQIRLVPVDNITPNPNQPRTAFSDESIRDLATSIRTAGLLQPLIVRPKDGNTYELVAGERRWRAAKLAGLATVPVVIRELSDAQSLELALIENLQREDLTPIERATAYQHYLDTFRGTIDKLAQRLSESRANVSNYLRLLKLPDEIRTLLARNELAMGQARAIAAVPDPERQIALARMAVRRNLSVRQVEELAKQASTTDHDTPDQPTIAAPTAVSRHLADLEQAFSRSLGLRVRLYAGRRKNSGRVVISYSNLDEFDRLARHFGPDLKPE